MIVALSKGQEELKALIVKNNKKTKRIAGVAHMSRIFRGLPRRVVNLASSSKEGENQEVEAREEDPSPKESYNETDYNEEQYPPGYERYKQLEERLSAMEIQKVPGLDFEELGLVSGVVIPPKFKEPIFAKYDGVSCPKMHLHSYVRKIQPHTADKDLWVHFFQDSLSGTQLDWFYQLEGTNSCTWEDLAATFYKQYQYNDDLAPTRVQLQKYDHGIS